MVKPYQWFTLHIARISFCLRFTKRQWLQKHVHTDFDKCLQNCLWIYLLFFLSTYFLRIRNQAMLCCFSDEVNVISTFFYSIFVGEIQIILPLFIISTKCNHLCYSPSRIGTMILIGWNHKQQQHHLVVDKTQQQGK